MSMNVNFAASRFQRLARFVLVNDRVPSDDEHCAVCGSAIETSYVRDFRTRLIYCDAQCFAGGAYSATKNRMRKAS
jgi:hypothetical protein